jgi:hypothetical protein
MLPLLRLGYIMASDMSWGPLTPHAPTSSNTWLLTEILIVLAKLITSSLVQKLILLTLFILAGIGAHRLASLSRPLRDYPLAAYAAGMLYIFNPFVYSRLMQGQWLVLLGYALLPWAVASLWRLMQKPAWSTAWRACVWAILVAMTSLHAVGFVALAAVMLFVAAGEVGIRRRAVWCLALAGAWAVANALWLVPALTGHSHISSEVGSFGAAQLQAFATSGTIHGSVPLSSLLLEGFWPDRQFRYTLPSTLVTWWPAVILLGSLITIGIVHIIRKRDRLGLALLVLGLIAWWLGMGVGWRWSAPTTQFLVDHVPFYRGYREPQKWLMVLALAYSYFAANGTAWLMSRLKSAAAATPASDKVRTTPMDWRPVIAGVAALLPLLLVPILLWGAGGQLKSVQYPADWYAVRAILDKSAGDSPVVVLPWHMYLRLSFAGNQGSLPGRVVANPASHFFPQNVVTGNDAELRGVPAINTTPLERVINTKLLPQRNTVTDAGAVLRPYKVRYIILYKEADWGTYDWLDHQTDLRVAYDGPHIRLYEVRAGN